MSVIRVEMLALVTSRTGAVAASVAITAVRRIALRRFLAWRSRRRQARQQVCRQFSAKSERHAEPEYRILQAACCMWDRLMLIAYALLSSNHSGTPDACS
jgi:hypothetical protein